MFDDDQDFEPWGNEIHDYEFPDEDDDDDSTETVPCPHCGAEVYEDAVRCPVCGAYITQQSNVFAGRSTWWIIMGLLGIVATVAMLAGLFVW